jgi:heat shock protein HslJ
MASRLKLSCATLFFEQYFKASEDFYISLKFSKNIISGKAGCQKYNGPYFVLGNYLFTGLVFSDAILCVPDEINQLNTDYLSALGRANHYENSGDELRLLDLDDNILAVFTAQSEGLPGSQWRVVYFIDNRQNNVYPFFEHIKKIVGPLPGTTIRLRFSEDQLSGSAGCNGYFGRYEIENGFIQITERGNSIMTCPEPPGLIEQESLYFEALRSVTAYRLDGDYLELRTAGDEIAVSLVKAP